LRSVYYRITTESEIKVYKLKNLFVKRNWKNEIQHWRYGCFNRWK
jgi:hypothetical protein